MFPWSFFLFLSICFSLNLSLFFCSILFLARFHWSYYDTSLTIVAFTFCSGASSPLLSVMLDWLREDRALRLARTRDSAGSRATPDLEKASDLMAFWSLLSPDFLLSRWSSITLVKRNFSSHLLVVFMLFFFVSDPKRQNRRLGHPVFFLLLLFNFSLCSWFFVFLYSVWLWSRFWFSLFSNATIWFFDSIISASLI